MLDLPFSFTRLTIYNRLRLFHANNIELFKSLIKTIRYCLCAWFKKGWLLFDTGGGERLPVWKRDV